MHAGSGYECSALVEQDDCNDVPDMCDVNAQCLYDDQARRYACRCNRGFDGDGRHCSRVGKLLQSCVCRIDVKNVQIKIKNVTNVKKRDKNKKNICKRNKKRYLFLL